MAYMNLNRVKHATRAAAASRALLATVALAAAMWTGGCAHRNGSGSTMAGKDGDTYDARRKMAHQLVATGEWQPAFATVTALHRERPDDADVLVLRGIIYRERNLWRESEDDLNQALTLDASSAPAHAALAILCELTHRSQDAEAHHQKAVALEPNNPAYLNNLGFSLFLHGKAKEAIEAYERAARLDPLSQRTRTNLGFAYASRGDMARASQEFEMGGTPAEAKNNLGFAYERRGDLRNAYVQYLEAARLDPRSRRARENLVHVASVLGETVPADVASSNRASESSESSADAVPSASETPPREETP